MPSHREVIEGLIAQRDEARTAARAMYAGLESLAPVYLAKSFLFSYPWLEEIEATDENEREAEAEDGGSPAATRAGDR